MIFQPLSNIPALYIPKKKMVVIADLHIGIENELQKQGVHTESLITTMEQTLLTIIKQYQPKDIIFLGDIKHSIPSTPFFEKKQLSLFLKRMQQHAQVHILPGNHDGGIEKIIPEDIIIHRSDGYKIDSFAFIHGHRWPGEHIMNCSYLFCGHTHPTIKLTDRLGYHSYEPCWIKSGINTSAAKKRYSSFNESMMIMLLPVFNPLCGGIAVNDEGIVGPMKHLISPNQAEVYLLDGTFIGTVNALNAQRK